MCEVRFLPPGETLWDAILRAKRLWFLALIFSDSLENRTEERSLTSLAYCAHALRVGDQFDSDDLS